MVKAYFNNGIQIKINSGYCLSSFARKMSYLYEEVKKM